MLDLNTSGLFDLKMLQPILYHRTSNLYSYRSSVNVEIDPVDFGNHDRFLKILILVVTG